MNIYYLFLMYLFINLIVSLIIIIRGLLSRIRYDELIYLCWKIILPFILNYIIIIIVGFKFIFTIIIYGKINRKFIVSLICFQNIYLFKIINCFEYYDF